MIAFFLLTPQVAADQTPHDPIYIDENSDFSDNIDRGVVNSSASGTENDPYIIENWIINASTGEGIWIRNTTAHFVIRNCVIENGKSNSSYGIFLENIENGTIDNNLAENNRYGFGLDNSSGNVLENNLVENNDYGFDLRGSSDNNLIFHNRIINNDTQAHDEGSNQWDNGYPSGGNNWSDYNGVDSDGDGIGDSPYHIPGDNNQDNYPLVSSKPSTPASPVILRGFDGAYNESSSGIEPWVKYEPSSNPPVMVGEQVGNGRYIAGPVHDVKNYLDDDGTPVDLQNKWCTWKSPDNLPGLFSEAFQWMVPDAKHVLWYEGYDVYRNTSRSPDFVKALGSFALVPTDDAYVVDGVSADNKYGASGAMYVGTDHATGENKRALLKFDLSEIPAKDDINSVILHAHNGTYSTPVIVSAYAVANDNWSEETINWNTAPWKDVGAKLDSDPAPAECENFNEWDVTTWVENQISEDQVASIILQSENEGVSEAADYYSKESANHNPGDLYLEIIYEKENVWNNELEENYPVGGDGLGYEIYVEHDPFENAGLSKYYDVVLISSLELGNKYEGGDPALLPDSEVEAIESFVRGNGGGLLVLERCDHLSYNYCRIQNKILRGIGASWRFQHDQLHDNVNNDWVNHSPQIRVCTDSPVGSAFYKATGCDNIELASICSLTQRPELGIDVSISPSENNGIPGSVMNYEISVFNSGNVPDNYLLESDDNQAWSLSLENYTLENVAPSENLMTTLSVTIPENADPGTKNNIVVTATSQENFQIIDSTSCIAEVIKQQPADEVSQPADEEEPQEQGRETLTVFVTLLVVLLAILAFAVWWRKRE